MINGRRSRIITWLDLSLLNLGERIAPATFGPYRSAYLAEREFGRPPPDFPRSLGRSVSASLGFAWLLVAAVLMITILAAAQISTIDRGGARTPYFAVTGFVGGIPAALLMAHGLVENLPTRGTHLRLSSDRALGCCFLAAEAIQWVILR